MNYDDLGFMATLAGRIKDYSYYDLQGNNSNPYDAWLAYNDVTDDLEALNSRRSGFSSSPKLKQEFILFDPSKKRKRLRTAVSITPSLDPGAPAGTVSAIVRSSTGKYTDEVASRPLRETIYFNSLKPKQALALIENIKKNPELADLMSSEAFYNKAHEVDIKSDQVKKVLDKWFDPSGLDLKPGTPIRLFSGPAYEEVRQHRKKIQRELFDALNKRVHGSNALMTAGMGLAGALAGDEDSRLKTSILGALGTGLGTYGSTYASQLVSSDKLQNKLYRLLVRRPWLRMGAGALGGLAGILAGKGTSGSDEGGIVDELADKVEDLTGADVKGSDMLKYILLGGGGLAALGGLGYAATRKKKKKSEEKRDA